MRCSAMSALASASVASGPMTMGSTTSPASKRLTRRTSSACSGIVRLRCTTPSPPACAIAMARPDSVTVSIAEDTMGSLSAMRRVRRVDTSALGRHDGGRAGLQQHVVEGKGLGPGGGLDEEGHARSGRGGWRRPLSRGAGTGKATGRKGGGLRGVGHGTGIAGGVNDRDDDDRIIMQLVEHDIRVALQRVAKQAVACRATPHLRPFANQFESFHECGAKTLRAPIGDST